MKSILFNTGEVRAIQDGRKTVTRRVVKPQPEGAHTVLDCDEEAHTFDLMCGNGGEGGRFVDWAETVKAPFWPGDILYVRETWQVVYETEWADDTPYAGKNIRELIPNFDQIPKVEAGISSECKSAAMPPRMKYYVFRASDIAFTDAKNGLIWRPSIHMPKEAARIFLRVTDVRVERLWQITVEGILAEGVDVDVPPICKQSEDPEFPTDKQREKWMKMTEAQREEYASNRARATYIGWCDYADRLFRAFSRTWNSTLRPAVIDTYGWEADPWVWVIEFERISKEEAERMSRWND